MRLGSKYEFEDLREEALFRLRAAFPTTLEVWDATAHDYTIPPRPSLLIDIVNLALEQGIMSILPSAYFLCIESGEDIVSLLVSAMDSVLNSLPVGKDFRRVDTKRRIEGRSPS